MNQIVKTSVTRRQFVVASASAAGGLAIAVAFPGLLDAASIGPQLHYIPIPAHALYRRLGYTMDGLPNAQAYWEQALSLPMFPAMQPDDVTRVARELQRALDLPLD